MKRKTIIALILALFFIATNTNFVYADEPNIKSPMENKEVTEVVAKENDTSEIEENVTMETSNNNTEETSEEDQFAHEPPNTKQIIYLVIAGTILLCVATFATITITKISIELYRIYREKE